LESIVNRFASWIKSGLALELSHFFIIFVIFILTTMVIYKLFLILENRKFVSSRSILKSNLTDDSWLPIKIQNWIKNTEKSTNIKVLPFVFKYFIIASLLLLVNLFLPFLTDQYSQYMLLVCLASVFIIYMPFQMLKTMALNRQNKMSLELPEYLESFALIKQQQTLYQTTLNSAKFAGPTIKPYVDDLILDVKLNPGSSLPYQTFAKELDNVDVETFMNTMVETSRVDEKIANDLIAEELRLIGRMRSDVYTAIIEEVEAKVGTRNMMLSFPILLIILVFMFYAIAQIVIESGIM